MSEEGSSKPISRDVVGAEAKTHFSVQVGDTLCGRYRMLEEIGRGCSAIVYKAKVHNFLSVNKAYPYAA